MAPARLSQETMLKPRTIMTTEGTAGTASKNTSYRESNSRKRKTSKTGKRKVYGKRLRSMKTSKSMA